MNKGQHYELTENIKTTANFIRKLRKTENLSCSAWAHVEAVELSLRKATKVLNVLSSPTDTKEST